MRYILNAKQMKKVDHISIHQFGIPSMVLMERAALGVVNFIVDTFSDSIKVLCVCGKGNNGADGIAIARILSERGYDATILSMGADTQECQQQLEIAINSGVKIIKYARNKAKLCEYNLIVDALFGIGLSRPIEGDYLDLIHDINQSNAKVVAVDIPSGIHSSSGQILGDYINADYTITFGYLKVGLCLYPGNDYCGIIKIIDIGFPKMVIDKIDQMAFTFTREDVHKIPKRDKNSNKGSFGKVLVVAGSELMGGAACLAGLSAYRSGSGLVKVLTHENNRDIILRTLPEALITTYSSNCQEDYLISMVEKELEWASCIIIGPGLSKCKTAEVITSNLLKNTKVPTIIDADALNIISDMTKQHHLEKNIFKFSNSVNISYILTPHMGEMVRLSGFPMELLKSDPISCSHKFIQSFMNTFELDSNVILVLKDARTIVTNSNGDTYINCSGNSGMAKGGSGDVLTGVIAGLISNQMSCYEASCMGVFIHGLAGDESAVQKGEYGMKAGDIIDNLCLVMK